MRSIVFLISLLTLLNGVNKKPASDCSLVGNDVAKYLQSILIEMRQTQAPDNCCGAFLSISLGTNDQNTLDNVDPFWRNDFNMTASNDFYFSAMKDHINGSFRRYDMGGGEGISASNNNTWLHRAGISDEKFISPFEIEHIAKRYAKSNSRTNHFAKAFGEGTQCSIAVHVLNEWYISKPVNEMRGFVHIKKKNDQEEKLKKGLLRFTRLGPNNSKEIEFEAKVIDGMYVTEPKMPSGHYKVELLEPKRCKQVLEENWIFKSGIDMSKNFKVACEGCFWHIEVEGKYTICGNGTSSGCKNVQGSAIWDSLPIAVGDDQTCHEKVPLLQKIPESPFDMIVLNPEIEAKLTGDFVNSDSFYINIATVIPKKNISTPPHMQLGGEPIMIDFHSESKSIESFEDKDNDVIGMRDEFGVGATHQCFIPAQGFMKWGECKDKKIKEKLMDREAFSFTINEKDPFSREKSMFRFIFTPVE